MVVRRRLPPSKYQNSESLMYIERGASTMAPELVLACVVAPVTTEQFAPLPMGEKEERTAAEAVRGDEREAGLFITAPDADDERGDWTSDELEAQEAVEIEEASAIAEAAARRDAAAETLWHREQALLDRMQEVAETARHLPDFKTRRLIDWVRESLCPGLPVFGERLKSSTPQWNERRK